MIKFFPELVLRIATLILFILDLVLTVMVLFPASFGFQMSIIALWGVSITLSVALLTFFLLRHQDEKESS